MAIPQSEYIDIESVQGSASAGSDFPGNDYSLNDTVAAIVEFASSKGMTLGSSITSESTVGDVLTLVNQLVLKFPTSWTTRRTETVSEQGVVTITITSIYPTDWATSSSGLPCVVALWSATDTTIKSY